MQPTNNEKSVGEAIKMHYVPNLPHICRTFISHSPTAHMESCWQNSNCTLTPLELCLIWQTFPKPVTHGFQATLHQWFCEKGITVWRTWQRLTFSMSLFVDKNSFNAFPPVQQQILLSLSLIYSWAEECSWWPFAKMPQWREPIYLHSDERSLKIMEKAELHYKGKCYLCMRIVIWWF